MKNQILRVSLCAIVLWGCARYQPTAPAIKASDYTPTGLVESVTLKDSSIHYDPDVMKAGAERNEMMQKFGEPNESRTTDSGEIEDVYAFNPDGSKFVNPKLRPRNVALGFFTMGTSVAVRQARLELAEKKLTLYHVLYGADGKARSVTEEKLSNEPSTPAGSSGGESIE